MNWRALLHRLLVLVTGMPDAWETPQQPTPAGPYVARLPGRNSTGRGERHDTEHSHG